MIKRPFSESEFIFCENLLVTFY